MKPGMRFSRGRPEDARSIQEDLDLTPNRSRIRFFGKRRHDRTLVNGVKTETGSMKVSTPEAAAIDLLRYAPSAGGINNVATVIAELSERIEPGRLVHAAGLVLTQLVPLLPGEAWKGQGH